MNGKVERNRGEKDRREAREAQRGKEEAFGLAKMRRRKRKSLRSGGEKSI